MPATKIVKRTGEVVIFDRARIRNAVAKAIRAVGTEIDPARLDAVVDRVVAEVDERFVDFFPNVENIQDIVEKHLVREGLYEIAKAYILYRADRQRQRDAENAQAIERARLGRLTVQTRDGRVVLFNLKKCEDSVRRLAADLGPDVSIERVVQEAMRTVYDGIPTTQIERALVLAAAAFIEQDPAYSFLAARLQLEALIKEVTGQSLSASPAERDAAYRMSFKIAIRNGLDTGLFDARLRAFDLDALAVALRPERDWLFQYLGVQTLADRYLARHDGRCVELPQAFWMRVAMGLAIGEPDGRAGSGPSRTARAIEFYELMSELLYVPSTPTLFHAGTPHPQLSSCYLTTIKDDLGHIFKSLSDNAQLSKWSGGLGNDWTNIRGTGARIKSTKVESQGVVPFLKVANDVTMAINRSGKRRGATCAYLETWHYDIEDFLDLRRNTGDERRRTHDMNTANWIPDLFMKRVMADGTWTLFSPDEVSDLHDLYGRAFERRYEEYEARAARGEMALAKTVSATTLWRKMLTMLFETGHPWITFKDPCNIRSPQDHAGVVHSSNLCTEITLNTSEEETAVCNLGSVNLARHVVDGRLDEARLAHTVATAIRMLDNVIDINFYPTVEAERSNLRHRPIGLGIMGFQDALFLLDVAYDSPAALDFADRTMELISYHAILTSSRLAAERGAYETFAGSKWSRGLFPADTLSLLEEQRGMPLLPLSLAGAGAEAEHVWRRRRLDWAPVYAHVAAHGMRNSNTMAVAPTATIANIAGCFPCIEPIYKNIYVKANISGEFTVVNAYLVRDLKALGLWNTEMLDQLKYFDGNVQMIAGIPDHLKAKYREAFEIDPVAALQLTAARGKWVDQSQSHNVFIKGTSGKKLSEVYQTAWRLGLKTTYYLRSMAASQIEKSTLDASKFGFTQKRDFGTERPAPAPEPVPAASPVAATPSPSAASAAAPAAVADASAPLCRIDDPDCEACQ